MTLLFDLLTTVTLPLVGIMALGYVAQRRLRFDLPSLSRLVVYVILPAALVHFLWSGDRPLAAVAVTAGFTVAQFMALLALGWGVGRLLRLPRGVLPVVALAAAFPNSGNYGIPLIELAFGPGFVMHQAIITSMHAILIVAVGVPLLTARRGGSERLSPMSSARR